MKTWKREDFLNPLGLVLTLIMIIDGVHICQCYDFKSIENIGTWASLFEKIGYAYDYYEQGDISTAKETLNAFINELTALSGKKIDSASADMLIQFATEIMARL